MTFPELNASVAAIVLRHSVFWMPAGDAEMPHIAYTPEELAQHHRLWASKAIVPVPDYSRNWADCLEVITSMFARAYGLNLQKTPSGGYWAGFAKSGSHYVGAHHENAATAVCMGALRALGAWDADHLAEVVRYQKIKRSA